MRQGGDRLCEKAGEGQRPEGHTGPGREADAAGLEGHTGTRAGGGRGRHSADAARRAQCRRERPDSRVGRKLGLLYESQIRTWLSPDLPTCPLSASNLCPGEDWPCGVPQVNRKRHQEEAV